jgi:hypothetical protein
MSDKGRGPAPVLCAGCWSSVLAAGRVGLLVVRGAAGQPGRTAGGPGGSGAGAPPTAWR